MTRKILVTGATGQQGRSLIAALRPREGTDTAAEYRVLALTRNTTSPTAKRLAEEKHVTVVQGDLNSRASLNHVFEEAKEDGSTGIWGVFMVLAFPGLGKNADAEEAQGKVSMGLSLFDGSSIHPRLIHPSC